MEVTEKKLKEIMTGQRDELQRHAEKQREELQRYMGVLKEDFDSKLELLIGEQFGSINAKLDSNSEMLTAHSETLASHTQMLGVLMENLTIVKDDVCLMKGELKRKVYYEEFEVLEKRVAALEAKKGNDRPLFFFFDLQRQRYKNFLHLFDKP